MQDVEYYVATITKNCRIKVVGLYRNKKDAEKALLLQLAKDGLLYHYPDAGSPVDEDCYLLDADFINRIDFHDKHFNIKTFINNTHGESYRTDFWNWSLKKVKLL